MRPKLRPFLRTSPVLFQPLSAAETTARPEIRATFELASLLPSASFAGQCLPKSFGHMNPSEGRAVRED